MKRFLLVAILPLMVSACAGSNDVRATNALGIACDAYATALEQATPYKAKMSVATVARVNDANDKVAAVCTTKTADNVSTAILMVQQAIQLVKTATGSN